MISFRKYFIFILIGVVFLNFLLVFLSFNVLMNRYIKGEAEKGLDLSLSGVMETVQIRTSGAELFDLEYQEADGDGGSENDAGIAANIGTEGRPDLSHITVKPSLPAYIANGSWDGETDFDSVSGSDSGAPSDSVSSEGYEPASDDAVGVTAKSSTFNYSIYLEGGESMPLVASILSDGLDVPEEEVQTISLVYQAFPATQTLLDMKYILYNEDNEVIYPLEGFTTRRDAGKVEFITSYYQENEAILLKEASAKAVSENEIYYVSLLPLEGGYDMLVYADITQLQGFSNIVNWTLCALMLFSGVTAVVAGIRMCGGMNRTLSALSGYAKRIGEGDFAAFSNVDHHSRYMELDQLGQSMSEMALKLQKYDERQKQFFQNVSHELRTPLMSIAGYAEGIAQDVFPDSKEAASVILDESKDMTELVNQLLYVSRLDVDLQGLEKEDTDLVDFLLTCKDKVLMEAQSRNVEICLLPLDAESTGDEIAAGTDVGERITDMVDRNGAGVGGEILTGIHAAGGSAVAEEDTFCGNNMDFSMLVSLDREKMVTAVTNILSNCVRYAKSRIRIEAGLENENLCLRISDDGDGIAEKDLPSIFTRFYKGNGGNAGLGLSIALEIIEAHGGTLTAENKAPEEYGESGARFVIEIPVDDV